MRKSSDPFASAERKRKHIEFLLQKEPEQAALLIQAQVPSGLYRHFKSTKREPKFYLVAGPVQDVDSRTWSVTYMALYQPHFGKLGGRKLLCPGSGFLVPVDRKRYRGKRFVLEEKIPLENLFQRIKDFVPLASA